MNKLFSLGCAAILASPIIINAAAPRAEAGVTPATPATSPSNFENAAAGSYQGFVYETLDQPVGNISVKLDSKARISGSYSDQFLGLKFKFKGIMPGNGRFTRVFEIGGVEYVVAIFLGKTDVNGVYRMSGALAQDGISTLSSLVLERSGFHKRNNPAPIAGRYTALLPTTNELSYRPRGDGYALVNVATNGKVKITGSLGDGTKLSASGVVSGENEWLFYKTLYRSTPKGGIGGRIVFSDTPQKSDFSGSILWQKRSDVREKKYPTGFEENTFIVGSKFTPPHEGEVALPEIDATAIGNNSTWQLGFGNTAIPATKQLAWAAGKRPVTTQLVTGESLKIVPNNKTGLVKGTYYDKITKTKINFAGVAFQKQNVIAGNFTGVEQTGFVEIKPIGAPDIVVFDASTGSPLLDRGSAWYSGQTSETIENLVQIRNDGNANLVIDGIKSIGRTENEDLKFGIINGGKTIIPPGESHNFWTTYTARGIGNHQTTISICSQLGEHTYEWECEGLISGAGPLRDSGDEWDGTTSDPEDAGFGTPILTVNPMEVGGTYQGFLTENVGSKRITGFVRIKLSKKNTSFSGKATINGKKHTVRGAFISSTFVGTTSAGLTFQLSILESGAPDNAKRLGFFTGTMGNFATSHRAVLFRAGFQKRNNPATSESGRYTVLLPSTHERGEATPNGDGYGTVTVGLDGKIRSAITLADGTRVTNSSFLTTDRWWALYQNIYRTKPNRGFLAGHIKLRDVPDVSDFDGRLQWRKFGDAREKRFGRGFDITQQLVGSRYIRPVAGERAADVVFIPSGIAQFRFFETNASLTGIQDSNVTIWDERNRITFFDNSPETGNESIKAKVNTKTGILSGIYTDKTAKLKFKFGGAIFNKQDILTGHIRGHQGVFFVN